MIEYCNEGCCIRCEGAETALVFSFLIGLEKEEIVEVCKQEMYRYKNEGELIIIIQGRKDPIRIRFTQYPQPTALMDSPFGECFVPVADHH